MGTEHERGQGTELHRERISRKGVGAKPRGGAWIGTKTDGPKVTPVTLSGRGRGAPFPAHSFRLLGRISFLFFAPARMIRQIRPHILPAPTYCFCCTCNIQPHRFFLILILKRCTKKFPTCFWNQWPFANSAIEKENSTFLDAICGRRGFFHREAQAASWCPP